MSKFRSLAEFFASFGEGSFRFFSRSFKSSSSKSSSSSLLAEFKSSFEACAFSGLESCALAILSASFFVLERLEVSFSKLRGSSTKSCTYSLLGGLILSLSSLLKILSISASSKPSLAPSICFLGASSSARSNESRSRSASSSWVLSSASFSTSFVGSVSGGVSSLGSSSTLIREIRSVGKKGLWSICILSCILLFFELRHMSFLHLFSKFFKSALISLSTMMNS